MRMEVLLLKICLFIFSRPECRELCPRLIDNVSRNDMMAHSFYLYACSTTRNYALCSHIMHTLAHDL